MFYESLANEDWPVALDLEDTSLVVIMVAFEVDIEDIVNTVLKRVRAASASMLVLVALGHMDVDASVWQSMLAQLSTIAGPAFSVQSEDGVNDLLDAIVSGIAWDRQPSLSSEDFQTARSPEGSQLLPIRQPFLPASSVQSRPVWLAQLSRLFGQRALADRKTVIGARVFEPSCPGHRGVRTRAS